MKNRDIAKDAIHAVFGVLSTGDLERLTAAAKAIETAGAHYGLNSQVAANQNFSSIVRDTLDRMPVYYVRELADKLPTQVCSVAHDRALIAFGSDVLETMHRHADWSSDTAAEIADSAHNFGLAHANPPDLASNFNVTARAAFENPLNL